MIEEMTVEQLTARYNSLFSKPCCDWNHVRPCGPVPGNPLKDQPGYEPICACGCSGYDERCGGSEWWHPAPTMDELLDNTIFKSV